MNFELIVMDEQHMVVIYMITTLQRTSRTVDPYYYYFAFDVVSYRASDERTEQSALSSKLKAAVKHMCLKKKKGICS